MMVTILLVLVCITVSIIFTYHVISYDEPFIYTVKSGDTLWGISKTVYGEMQDAREMVYLMMQINEIEDPGQLQPGMKIYLPIRVD
jgi:spore germination protein YaaH